MQALTSLLALAAPIAASIKHDGKDHFHPKQGRQGVQGLEVLATPTPAAAVTTASSIAPTISSYVFPTTVIQEPVATVCPDTPASSAIFSILPVSSLAFMAGSNATRGSTNNIISYTPVQVNATALLPNGSTTASLSVSSSAVLPTSSVTGSSIDTVGAETARIVLGRNGCQTVFSAKTTTWCSTTVQPVGMLPVSITDCDQRVIFSSQRLDGCSATITTSPLSSGAVDGHVAYYLAHWYDLIQGPIPNHVQVQDCLPKSNGLDCVTSSESWDVVTSTTTSTGMSLASFAGPAVITSGIYTVTTTLSFESTLTTTAVVTLSAIERYRLGGSTASTTTEQTVTVLVTMPTSRTLSLNSLARTTVTIHQTSTVEVTETRTRSLINVLPNAAGGTTA